MQLRKEFNNSLDKLVRPETRLLRRLWSTFQVCGYTGLALAILLSMTLVIHQGLSPFIMLTIILAAVLTFFAQAIITKIILGEEDLVYYRHEIAVMTVAALLLWLLHQPILPYLDATLLGIGIFLACGRVGCLMVGCCHGRPYNWGVCYRQEHADAGFEQCYVGVRLFPSQAIESFWVFSIVLVGSLLVLSNHQPGTALTWYVVTYDIGRFYFEFIRGDVERPYLRGFSEAQWVSVVLMCIVVVAEWYGLLPFQLWHVLATLCVVATMLAVAGRRRWQKTPRHQLLHPYHIKEVAEVLQQRTPFTAKDISISHTPLGIRLSSGVIKGEEGDICHYTLSQQEGEMAEETAKIVAKLIVQLKHPLSSYKVIKGNRGVFHLLIDVSQEANKHVYQTSAYRVVGTGAV
jgi:hypothetical protein